ncbi:MAG: FG-GAP repeat protein, partial [Planctomycetales bacterium]|nr:FG-GAP repeat protein [Planctomycetales bacterium]
MAHLTSRQRFHSRRSRRRLFMETLETRTLLAGDLPISLSDPDYVGHLLQAGDGQASDVLGRAVAIDGDLAVIGAPLTNIAGAADAGAVYVYRLLNSSWQQRAKLIALDANANDQFGSSVAIQGATIVVGAPLDDEFGADAGAAYVFVGSDSTWTEDAKLSNAAAGDHFGHAVSVDQDRIVVGSPLDDTSQNNTGSAFIYERNTAGQWPLINQVLA